MQISKILFIGELPGSIVNGISLSNDKNLQILGNSYVVKIIEERVDTSQHGILSFKKIVEFTHRIFSCLLMSCRNRFNYIYLILPTSFFGQLKILFTICFLKILNSNSSFILHIHRGDIIFYLERIWINRIMFSLIIKLSHKLLVLSEQLLIINEQKRLFNAGKFAVLPNTVYKEQEFFIENRNEKIVQFVYISHYIPDKGHEFLLNYFSSFRLFDFSLFCYGKIFCDEYFEKLKQYDNPYIKLFDEIKDDQKYTLFSKTDFFVMPSLNEGQPLVILEAMMSGVIVIANNVGFIAEMFWQDYPFIYNGNTKEEFDRIFRIIEKMDIDEIHDLKRKLKDHYYLHYSNANHELNLLKIFN